MSERFGVIAWCSPANYPRLRGVLHHPDKSARTFERWLDNAQGIEDTFLRSGIRVLRVDVEPDAFAAWCRAENRELDEDALLDFSNHLATEILKAEESTGEDDEQ